MDTNIFYEKEIKEYAEKVTQTAIISEKKRIIKYIFKIESLSAKEKEKILEIVYSDF